nr:hypothetical protein [uncultured Carboxylicivirga sp.]
MKNVLFLASNVNLKGAPKTRMDGFKNSFFIKGDVILEGNKYLWDKRLFNKYGLIYVETSSNRLTISDMLALAILRLFCNRIIVFIRDVYIEYFPENYKSCRGTISLIANRISYGFLVKISNHVVFPTTRMGDFFFKKNKKLYRPYSALPPGTINEDKERGLPNFENKLGILYLGAISYENSGFKNFIKFQRKYNELFNFFILTNEENVIEFFRKQDINKSVFIDYVPRHEIGNYLNCNNIGFAIHTRGRNEYDDMTFPIKVLDYISLRLPFISERHLPLVDLLGVDYELYCSVNDPEKIYKKIKWVISDYKKIVRTLDLTAKSNSYQKRYNTLLEIAQWVTE